jgi:hypothetical protein
VPVDLGEPGMIQARKLLADTFPGPFPVEISQCLMYLPEAPADMIPEHVDSELWSRLPDGSYSQKDIDQCAISANRYMLQVAHETPGAAVIFRDPVSRGKVVESLRPLSDQATYVLGPGHITAYALTN